MTFATVQVPQVGDAVSSGRLNRLRAAVLGANDGIVSTAGLVVGVAGATSQIGPVVFAGVAGTVAGALSMAGGEYVSVSAQRDAETVAGIPTSQRANPWHAGAASMLAFALGAVLPLLAIALPGVSLRVPVTVLAVVVALSITGWVSARIAGTDITRSVGRNVGIGLVATGLTFAVGTLIGAVLG